MNKHYIWATSLMVIVAMICMTIAFIAESGYTFRVEMDNNTKEAVQSINYSAIESVSNNQNKCFERTIRWDRIWDVNDNTFVSGSFYNTSWIETDCRKFNQDMIYNQDAILGQDASSEVSE